MRGSWGEKMGLYFLCEKCYNIGKVRAGSSAG